MSSLCAISEFWVMKSKQRTLFGVSAAFRPGIMAPKAGKKQVAKAGSVVAANAGNVSHKGTEPAGAGSGAGAAKDNDEKQAGQSAASNGAADSPQASPRKAGTAAAASMATKSATAVGQTATASESDKSDGKHNETANQDNDGTDSGDGDGDADADTDGNEDAESDGLPLATGPQPPYSIPLDPTSQFHGRYPLMDTNGAPIVTKRATGAGGCCDLFELYNANSETDCISVCQRPAEPECEANPGPRCSKAACLSAWHAEAVRTEFGMFGCVVHGVPKKNAMKQKATVDRAYKRHMTTAGLIAGSTVKTAAFELSEEERTRIRAIPLAPDEAHAPEAASARAVRLAVAKVGSDTKATIAKTAVQKAAVQSDSVAGHVHVNALLARMAALERAIENPAVGGSSARGYAQHAVEAAASAKAPAAMQQQQQQSIASVAADMKSGMLPPTFGWTTAFAPPATSTPHGQMTNMTALPPVPSLNSNMETLTALLMQQNAGVNQRPIDHAAREIQGIDQRAMSQGQRWFDVFREHGKAFKGRYDPWVHQLFMEIVTHLQRLLCMESKSWEDPMVRWLAPHMMALFYTAYGPSQSAKVLLFRGHYVSHVMTDKAAAHVVNAPGASDVRKQHQSAASLNDDMDGNHARSSVEGGGKNTKRKEKRRSRIQKDKAELANFRAGTKGASATKSTSGAGGGPGGATSK
jgi:hypothetical protein